MIVEEATVFQVEFLNFVFLEHFEFEEIQTFSILDFYCAICKSHNSRLHCLFDKTHNTIFLGLSFAFRHN